MAGAPHLDFEMWETMNLNRRYLLSDTPISEDSKAGGRVAQI
jgi:hypothetical protein